MRAVTESAPAPRRPGYGVRLVRGPFVKLPPHPEHAEDQGALLSLAEKIQVSGSPLAADLFSGAGGLSLGLEHAGFRVVLGADADPNAIRTHAHQFGGMSVDWDLAESANIARVARLCKEAGVELIAGGPPCQPFSRAGRSKIRHRVQLGLRDPYDERRDLWRAFLEIVSMVMPKAVLMENVPDMALDREMFILRSMVEELEQLGYSVKARVVEAWRYGVPQLRQRLILVALRDGIEFLWPEEIERRVTVGEAIGDLPAVEGGWRPEGGAEGWAVYNGPRTEFQARMRSRVDPTDSEKVFDHITRPVREDDRAAFESMKPGMKYTDLDADHQRYRTDIFDDKYNRLDENGLSRTITAHIAKDGYWYIHPDQPRTLTVREAARLQTFPDDFRFEGPPSAAFKQIGNAVPPQLGYVLGCGVRDAIAGGVRSSVTTREIADRLSAWFKSEDRTSAIPWLSAHSRWTFLVGEILLDRTSFADARAVWAVVSEFGNPSDVGADGRKHQAGLISHFAQILGRVERGKRLVSIAEVAAREPSAIEGSIEALKTVDGIGDSIADLAVLAVPGKSLSDGEADTEEPVLVGKGVLRVAARFYGNYVDQRNKMTEGRIAVARMIGIGPSSRSAQKGLIDLANGLCRSDSKACERCPLSEHCRSVTVQRDQYALW